MKSHIKSCSAYLCTTAGQVLSGLRHIPNPYRSISCTVLLFFLSESNLSITFSQLAHRQFSFHDLVRKRARCNVIAVLCGSVWTTAIISSVPKDDVKSFITSTGTSSPGICQNPDQRRRVTTETQQENPQRNENHVVRRSNDIFKSATQYNDKTKLCGNHEQKPEFFRYAEPVRINAIFEVSTDAK